MQLSSQTTHRRETEDGIEIRKAFSVPRDEIKISTTEKEDGTEVTVVEVPVSSTAPDRDGDVFTEEGLEDMAAQLDSGSVPMFLDHGLDASGFPTYRVLDAIGGWKQGIIEEAGEHQLLKARGELDPDVSDAAELENRLRNGVVPVGWSVGFIVQTENENEDIPGKEFESTDLLEVSSVGIPSNPLTVSNTAAAIAKSVAEETGYDGETGELAEAIQRGVTEPYQTMSESETDSETEESAAETSEGDPEEGTEPESESESEPEGEEADSEAESADEEPETASPDPEEIASVVRSELLSLVRESEEFRSELDGIVREAIEAELEDLEFETDAASLADELRSELFRDEGDGGETPDPAGKIVTAASANEERGENTEADSGASEQTPTPDIDRIRTVEGSTEE